MVTVDTFRLMLWISKSVYEQLKRMPGMVQRSKNIHSSSYYSRKGITHIEIKVYRYKDKKCGAEVKSYYLTLGFHADTVMGGSRVRALSLDAYTPGEIAAQIRKRIYEVNELRVLGIYRMDLSEWKLERIDFARDIKADAPCLLAFMLNRSFPYSYLGMEPFSGGSQIQQFESCYFKNKSRRINFYDKLAEINSRTIPLGSMEDLKDKTFRVEIQLMKKGVENLTRNSKCTNKRDILPLLDGNSAYGYLEREVLNIFGKEPYICRSAALGRIRQSRFKPSEQTVMAEIIQAIDDYKDLYHLEKAIAAGQAPPEFGSLKDFRKMLKKIRSLGFNPVTLPDCLAGTKYAELPSLYELLQQSKRKGGIANGNADST